MSVFKERLKTSFKFNVLVVLVLCIVLYILFFASLRCITHHGEQVAMPYVTGMTLDSASVKLNELDFDIVIDSTFEPQEKPLSVLKQVPDSGSFVKRGRTIFITVNMLTPPMVAMPNIKDLSYRSAEMILRNNKLQVGDTSYQPDIAAGAVLEARYKGAPISVGAKIPQGSKIDLVIGNGMGNTEWDVPDVTGMTVNEANIYLNQYNLQPIYAPSDPNAGITDTFEATITDQLPRPYNDAGERNRIKMGDFINLMIAQHPAPGDIHSNSGNNGPEQDVNDNNSKKR